MALAGCGGRDAPSREEYAAQAQGICARAAATIAPLERQVREAARLSEPDLVFRRTAELQRRLAAESARITDRLDAVRHDEEDEQLHAWLATMRRARVARQELADAYGARDLEAIARTAAARDRLGQRADAWARRTGMPACAAVT